MRLGVIFPQTELPPDPGAIRAYAQAAEELGYDHLLAYDHVLGADPSARPGWTGVYNHTHPFHEPFVLFGYLAAITRRLELVTGVLILTQRQTALVAKQAAEVDVLSGGRLRLGVGLGWNEVEYEALGEDFHTRGRRCEEAIAVMRALWTEEVANFQGRWHRVTAAGINPMPVQRPIPIWIGGRAEEVLKRTARLADGFFPMVPPDERGREVVERIRRYAQEAGRDPSTIGFEGRVGLGTRTAEECAAQAADWRALGATHLTFNTMGAGFKTADEHIAAIRHFKSVMDARAVAGES